METLKSGSERALLIVKGEYEKKITDMTAQFKEDLLRVDQLRRETQAKHDKTKQKHQQAMAQVHELKEVLQMAADADTRKDSLVEEVRATARETKLANDRERESLAKEREELENVKRAAKEESLAISGKLQESEYSQRETLNKLEMT